MSTVLLTWNPRHFDWYERDRRPFTKQGAEPRGIIGSGYATSDWFPGRDWRPDRKSPVVHYVELEYDALLDPREDEVLPVSSLNEGALRFVHWGTQSSGIRIRDDAANELERLWASHLRRRRVTPALTQKKGAPTQKRGGGGFGTFENNRAVQRAAVRHVTARLKKDGWTVENVENRYCGFDLLCRRLDEELHVEVKGASGPEQRFIITAGEVGCAEDDPLFQLRVVTGARFPGRKVFSYSGPKFLRAFTLETIQYKAVPKP